MNYNDIEVEKYANQISYKIVNSSIKNYPYPHTETSNILPNDILDEIENNFPKKGELVSNSDTQSVETFKKNSDEKHPYDFRYKIKLTDKKELVKIQKPRSDFWEFFTKTIASPIVIKSILKIYNNYIKKRFGDKINDITFFANIDLIHDRAKYSLGPHTDIKEKVAVMLIYLSSDTQPNSKDSYGTSLYIPKKTGFICDGTKHHNFQDFHKVYTSSFVKNNSFSFFRTGSSFHGVEAVPNKPIERKLIQYSIMAH